MTGCTAAHCRLTATFWVQTCPHAFCVEPACSSMPVWASPPPKIHHTHTAWKPGLSLCVSAVIDRQPVQNVPLLHPQCLLQLPATLKGEKKKMMDGFMRNAKGGGGRITLWKVIIKKNISISSSKTQFQLLLMNISCGSVQLSPCTCLISIVALAGVSL